MSSFGRRLEATGVRHEEKYSFRVRRGDRSSAVETTTETSTTITITTTTTTLYISEHEF